MRLPPPDPNEPSYDERDTSAPLDSPTVVFTGPPSREVEHVADVILATRPGVLFINREA